MPTESASRRALHAQSQCRDRAIALLARRQHGVVSRTQLVEAGLGRGAIAHRLKGGRLHRVFPSVYVVGNGLLSVEGRWLAGVLSGGPDAVLSHRSAAALWEILASAAGTVEVTLPSRRRSVQGIKLRKADLRSDEITTQRGIPVTSAARTILDLAAVLEPHRALRAVHEAEVRQLTGPLSLAELLDRHPSRRGARALRRALSDLDLGAQVSRSELEDRFHHLLEGAGLSRPWRNAAVDAGGRTFEADFVWRAAQVIVELDGHATPATRTTFEQDRLRDRLLTAAGWRVVRITWRQLHDDPGAFYATFAGSFRGPPQRVLTTPTAARRSATRRHTRGSRPMPRCELDTSTFTAWGFTLSMHACQATIPSRWLCTAVIGTAMGIRLRSSISATTSAMRSRG
ncbi:MAG: DUF559 domain-containing protein [Thermoleophilaceae bacterium]|nr:DUF559 domain-containing protein [Thermoleophilaceae bacterium]